MGGLFDLLFIALILWWIFRALGGGRGRMEEDGADALPGERPGGGRPAPGRPTARRPEAAAGAADEPEWRRRLKEAVRDWEMEQRRQAGEPVPGPGGPSGQREPDPWGSGTARPERAEARGTATGRVEAPPRSLEVEDEPRVRPAPRVEPGPAPGRAGPPPFPRARPAPPPPRRPPSPYRRPPEARPDARRPGLGDGRRREPAATRTLDLGPQIGERGEAGELATAGETPAAPGARRRHRPLELDALRRLSTLQRAIVYQEILGPPRSATPPAHGHWF